MKTYQEFYQNEVRPVSITLNDEDGNSFAPSAAYYTVKDSDDDVVIAESEATVSTNVVTGIITTAVTVTVGTYKIEWRLRKNAYTYYHVTDLKISAI